MSFPAFKDLDKSITGELEVQLIASFVLILLFYSADLLNDDFDYKYSLKIKSAGPANTVSDWLSQHSNWSVLMKFLPVPYVVDHHHRHSVRREGGEACSQAWPQVGPSFWLHR